MSYLLCAVLWSCARDLWVFKFYITIIGYFSDIAKPYPDFFKYIIVGSEACAPLPKRKPLG